MSGITIPLRELPGKYGIENLFQNSGKLLKIEYKNNNIIPNPIVYKNRGFVTKYLFCWDVEIESSSFNISFYLARFSEILEKERKRICACTHFSPSEAHMELVKFLKQHEKLSLQKNNISREFYPEECYFAELEGNFFSIPDIKFFIESMKKNGKYG